MVQAIANGRLVLEGEIVESYQGPWTARLELDDESGDLDGPITIAVGSAVWTGTANGEVDGGRLVVRVVGGKSQLSKELDAKYYVQCTLRSVLQDVMRETGEELDETGSEPAALTAYLTRWSRARGEARSAITEVCKAAGAFWRVSREGKVVVRKADLWLPVPMKHVVTERDPARGALTVTPEAEPLARPGVALGELRLRDVRTEIEPKGVTQQLTLELGRGATSIGGQLRKATERATDARLNYAQWYPCVVVKQDGDGTVEIYPDDPRVRGNGITRVPLRHGLPGCTVRVTPGQRVVLFFENADPQKPAAGLWPDGSSVQSVELKASEKVVLSSDVLIGGPTAAERMVLGDLLDELLRSLVVNTAMGPSSTPIITPVWAQYLSARHKVDR